MRHFVIEHPHHGFYIQHTMRPLYTWRKSEKAKRFSSREEAQRYLANHKNTLHRCEVIEKS